MKMGISKPDIGETIERVTRHLEIAESDEKRRDICLTWDGYISALLEWGLISPAEHVEIRHLIDPSLNADDPSGVIFLGIE